MTLLTTECPQLKVLRVDVDTGEIFQGFSTMRRSEWLAEAEEKYGDFLAGVRCPLDTLSINPLPGLGMKRIVEAFPNLRRLILWDSYGWRLEPGQGYEPSDFAPLKNLRLKVLDFRQLTCFNWLQPDKHGISTFDYLFGSGSLSLALEELILRWPFFRDWDHLIDDPRLFHPILSTIARCRRLRVLRFHHGVHERYKTKMLTVFRDLHSLSREYFPCLEELRLPCIDLRPGAYKVESSFRRKVFFVCDYINTIY